MASKCTACVLTNIDKLFHLPSSVKFPTQKIDQRIDLTNICGLVSSTFFIMHDIRKEQSAILPHTCHRYIAIGMCQFFWRKIEERNTGIIGANSGKILLVSYSSYA